MDDAAGDGVRRGSWMVLVAVVTALAAAAYVLVGPGFVSLDPMFSLAWGRQLAGGHLPSYDPGPTPHPLSNGLGALLYLGGPSAAINGLLALSFLSYAALTVATWVVARGFTGRVGATVAAGLIATNVVTLSSTLRAYLDIPYAALLMAAVAVEVRRPRSVVPVLLLLAIAGLLRPEAWFVAGFYWLWTFRDAPRSGWLTSAALVVVAPVLWIVSELVITGDPLFSFTGTKESAQAVTVYASGLSALFTDGPRTLYQGVGRLPAMVALVGLGVLLARRRRAGLRLAAITAAIGVSAAIPVAAGTLLNPRYVISVLALICVLAGAAVGEWRPGAGWAQRVTAALAVVCALVLVADGSGQASQVRQTERGTDRTAASFDALRQLLEDDVPCQPIVVPNGRLVPFISVWRDVPMSSITVATHSAPLRGTFVFGTPDAMAGTVTVAKRDVGKTLPVPPASASLVRSSRGWTVSAVC